MCRLGIAKHGWGTLDMKAQLRVAGRRLFSTYWFLPSVMALAAVGLSQLTVRLDRALEDRTMDLSWL